MVEIAYLALDPPTTVVVGTHDVIVDVTEDPTLSVPEEMKVVL